MIVAFATGLVASSLTLYPALGDRPTGAPPATAGIARVEAMIDKGPILELVLACPRGTAIVSYSKVERVFCGPRRGCDRSLATVARNSCR